MKNSQLAATTLACSLHCLSDLVAICHAGGNDHRLARCRDITDQRQVDSLERGDLVGRRVQILQQVHRSEVERRAEDRDVVLACVFEQRFVPFPGHVRLLVEFIQRLAIPQSATDLKVLGVAVQGNGVSGIGLQLDRIGTSMPGLLDNLQRRLQAPIMVSRQLGNDVGLSVKPNAPPCDGDTGCTRHEKPPSAPYLPLGIEQAKANDIMKLLPIEMLISQHSLLAEAHLAMEID